MTTQPPIIYLKDYQVPSHLIEGTYLDIRIDTEKTRVISTLKMRRNPASSDTSNQLKLHGGKLLELVSVSLNGAELSSAEYQLVATDLVLNDCPETFELRTECLIEPQNNTSLEGLYQSGGMFCTQCEAEGFRNITFYLDRPDAMSVFTTRISAPKQQYPVLLANGNPVEQGDEEQGRHFAVWHDPFPKPAYLFLSLIHI